MTTQSLVDRFLLKDDQLRHELSDLLLRDLENDLSMQEKERLNEFNRLFMWDVEFHVECSYQPMCFSTDGTYITKSLGEFLDLKVGETASELLVDDLEECSLEDFDGGEITVEGKIILVQNLRLKDNG